MFDYDRLHAAIATLREKRIFFIGGVMKSGTTWLQLLLDRHPEISCRGEGHFPTSLIPLFVRTVDEYNEHIAWKNESIFGGLEGYPLLKDEHRTYLWASAVSLLLAEQLARKPAPVVGEKTPDNVRIFGLLHAVFPAARFVQIVRDGRDCAVSGWFHNLRVSPDWARETYPSFDAYAAAFAEQWTSEVEAGAAFGAAHPQSYLMLRYEDLAADPPGGLAATLRFLGVADDPAVVAECCRAASFEQLSGRAPGEEDRASFFRKGAVGDWQGHFGAEALRIFEAKAGHALARFGYAVETGEGSSI